jgi:branched-chain amino acid aminotransferase
MTAVLDIPVQRVQSSKLLQVALENIPFGKHFTDHMLEADYVNGEWTNVVIRPYQPLSFDPSMAALHYGQAIFEGIKAYKDEAGNAYIFRPDENLKRFNLSAARMMMPEVPAELFLEGMRQLIALEKDWIPALADHSLYIRPFMFATDAILGVKAADAYKFMIILSPTGPYFSVPMKIWVEEHFTRAVAGGVGYAKNAGNYGASMYPTQLAREKGYDQVLWTDAREHRFVQEVGMMNVFFVFGQKVVTPSLEEGTILDGITRKSVLVLLDEMGYQVEERPLAMDEVMEAFAKGELTEVFGAGTAATISMIELLGYKEEKMHFDTQKFVTAPALKKALNDIRQSKVADTHGWMLKI